MKIEINIDVSGVNYLNEDYDGGDYVIEWTLPVLPRVEECIFLEVLDDEIPERWHNRMWKIWSIDWRYDVNGFYPKLWVVDIEDTW